MLSSRARLTGTIDKGELVFSASCFKSSIFSMIVLLSSSDLFAEQTKAGACKGFQNSFVGYHGKIFYVDKHCQRFHVNVEEFNELNSGKSKKFVIQEASSKFIAATKYQGKYNDKKVTRDHTCKKYKGKYISSTLDVYYVNKSCEKRMFLDWASYESHRGALNINQILYFVSMQELDALKNGLPMNSVIDKEFKEQFSNDRLDILPVDEACRGLINRYVTYLDKIYFIEKTNDHKKKSLPHMACTKREVDGEEFSRLNMDFKFDLELTSSQALSIPDGEAFHVTKIK